MAHADAGRIWRAGLLGLVPNTASLTAPNEGANGAWGPEAELLLCCARLDLPQAKRDRALALLQSELDWAYLINLASGHGLLPLLYRHLDALAATALPRDIIAALWAHYEGNARRNRAMADELLFVLRTLDAHGIPAIAFKGPALAAAVYGDLALREFGDLDILLRLKDVLPAGRLLQEHGYVLEYDLKPDVEAAFLRSRLNYHLVLMHAHRPVTLELHWKTDTDFPVEPVADDQWWAKLESADLDGEKIRCFNSEELLLILCLHGSKHGWCSLGWLVDVAELIRQHPDLDWDWIMDRSAQLRCERRLAVGLHLVSQLLDAPLPEKIGKEPKGAVSARKLADRILGMLFNPESRGWYSMGSIFLRLSLVEERPWRQCLLLKDAIFAPTLIEWSRWPLPRPLFFLYLPLRILRLIAKYAGPEPSTPRHPH